MMSKIFIIASIVNQKKLVGYRVFDCESVKYVDSTLQNISTLLESKKVKIENAIYEDNKIIGSSGSLDRLTKLDAVTYKPIGRLNSMPFIVVNKVEKNKFTLVDFSGKMEIMDKNKVLQIHDTYGLANCKVMRRGDNVTISPIAGNLDTVGKEKHTVTGLYSASDSDIILSAENKFIRDGLVHFNVTDKAAYDIVNSNRMSVPLEIMKKYCIGPIYLNKKGSTVRIASMFVSGLGEKYMDKDFGSIYCIPCNGIKEIKLIEQSDKFLLKITRCIVGANKKCIDIEDKIVLGRDFSIITASTVASDGQCPNNIKPNDSLYRRAARALGLEEYTNEEEFKKLKTKFKGFRDIVWMLNVEWDLVLENLGDSVNFPINDSKEYCYILDDVDTEEEMNHTMMVIAERPSKSFNIDKISRPFTVKMLELEEADDERSALIKLKLQNDIVIDSFKKVNILKYIANKMEVAHGE